MNKKSAFIVVQKTRRRMVLPAVNSCLNAVRAANNFVAVIA